jgi:hypothetical protein
MVPGCPPAATVEVWPPGEVRGLKVKTVLVLVGVAAVLVAINSSRGGPSQPTTPATAPRMYGSCAALNEVYPGGVARTAGSRNTGRATHLAPTVSAPVYGLNRRLDPDGDGIACER